MFEDPLVERAFHVAALALEGRVRLDGEPRLLHCVSTAGILAELGLDAEAIAAGLLHDVRVHSNNFLPSVCLFGRQICPPLLLLYPECGVTSQDVALLSMARPADRLSRRQAIRCGMVFSDDAHLSSHRRTCWWREKCCPTRPQPQDFCRVLLRRGTDTPPCA